MFLTSDNFKEVLKCIKVRKNTELTFLIFHVNKYPPKRDVFNDYKTSIATFLILQNDNFNYENQKSALEMI